MSHICLTYHIIWRTKCSQNTISEKHERDLYAYILGICKKKNCQLYRINSTPNHVHMCVSIHPTISVSGFMQVVKQETSHWLSEHREQFPEFKAWGNGYAAFSYSVADRPSIIKYISEQKAHHQRVSLKEEYEDLLRQFGIDPASDYFLKDE